MPDWGWWLVIGTIASILLGMLALSGLLTDGLRVLDSLMEASHTIGRLLGLYFAPTFVALGTPRLLAIAAANLLLGWTILGWVLALIWAIAEQCSKKPTPKTTPPPLP